MTPNLHHVVIRVTLQIDPLGIDGAKARACLPVKRFPWALIPCAWGEDEGISAKLVGPLGVP